MKKKIMLTVAIIVGLGIMVGMMMFDVSSVDDPDSILAQFTNISSTIKRPITVTEIARQMESENGSGSGDPSSMPGSIPYPQTGGTTWDKDSVQDAIQAHCDAEGSNADAWAVEERASGTYLRMKQTDDWSEVIADTGSSVSKQGCMLFALAATIANYSNRVYGVDELLRDLGYKVNMDTSGKWQVDPKLPCVGLDPTAITPIGAYMKPESILSKCGYPCSSDGQKIEQDKLANGYYLVHAKNDYGHVVSSSGEHWFLIVGVDGSNYETVCTSAKTVPISAFGSAFTINHCYYISR